MKFGIIGAMALETKLLIEKMDHAQEKSVAGMLFFEGKINHHDVVIVTSGVGKVNAAACTQILISEFKVQKLINTGVSGAIHEDLDVGDIVISVDCLEHDFDVTAFGYKFGMIPSLGDSVFAADSDLIEKAYSAGKEELTNHQIYKGRVVSGDQFVSSSERKTFIKEHFDAMTTEMEGAAIAHVAVLNQVPFVVIRSISDKADGSAHVIYDEFVLEAAKHSANIVLKMLG